MMYPLVRELAGYQRLPDSQQDLYACDKQTVTVANRSDTPVEAVTITFNTEYLATSADGTSSVGQPKLGPWVVQKAAAGIAPFSQAMISFAPCVPSAKSPYVFANPVNITWTWF